MYGVTMELSDEALSPDFLLPIGKAKIERPGEYMGNVFLISDAIVINTGIMFVIYDLFH